MCLSKLQMGQTTPAPFLALRVYITRRTIHGHQLCTISSMRNLTARLLLVNPPPPCLLHRGWWTTYSAPLGSHLFSARRMHSLGRVGAVGGDGATYIYTYIFTYVLVPLFGVIGRVSLIRTVAASVHCQQWLFNIDLDGHIHHFTRTPPHARGVWNHDCGAPVAEIPFPWAPVGV